MQCRQGLAGHPPRGCGVASWHGIGPWVQVPQGRTRPPQPIDLAL